MVMDGTTTPTLAMPASPMRLTDSQKSPLKPTAT